MFAEPDIALSRFLSLHVANHIIEHQTDTNTPLREKARQAHWYFVTITEKTVTLRAPFVDFVVTVTAAVQINARDLHWPTEGIAAEHEEQANPSFSVRDITAFSVTQWSAVSLEEGQPWQPLSGGAHAVCTKQECQPLHGTCQQQLSCVDVTARWISVNVTNKRR